MTMTASGVIRLLLATIREPAGVARAILDARPARDVLWTGLALVVVLSVLAVAVLSQAMPPAPEDAADSLNITPMGYAVVLGGSLVITVFALHLTGQMLGGKGAFDDTLALVVWLQVLLLVLQVVQAVLLLVSPLLGDLAAIATAVIALWVLLNFINVAQRFDSLGRAALTLVAALLGVGVGLSVLLGAIGAGV